MANGKKKQEERPAETLPEKVATTALATGGVSALALADAAAGNSGLEDARPDDMAIPYVYILQSLSPQIKKGHPARVEGAEEGDLFNNVSGLVVKPPVRVVPCAFQKVFVEWRPRETGGGFVQRHESEAVLSTCVRNEKNIDVLPNGNHIIPTAYHYVLVVYEDGRWERAVLSFTRTQLKKSRRWLTQMSALKIPSPNGEMLTPAVYSHSYEITTVMEQRDQYSWFGFVIGSPRMLESETLYREARRFREVCRSGAVEVAKPVEEDHDAPAATDESSPM